MILRSCLIAAAAILLLGACAKQVEAPTTPRVCYAAALQPDKTWKFNKVASDQKTIEMCAVELERMRLRFLRMGGNQREIIGTYQGQFIFLQDEGIFFSRKLDGVRYLALRRYNGKLVMPGAIPD